MNDLPPPAPRPSKSQLGDLVRDLKALPYNALFPFSDWLKAGLIGQPLTRMVLLLALFPLGIHYFLGNNASIQTSGWAFGVYFAAIWAYLLHLMVRPQSIRWSAALGVAIFTTLLGIVTVLFVQKFPVISWLYAATESPFSPFRLIGFILGVGLLEEAVKLAPVVYLVVKLREVKDLKQAAYYAGISGLAFGVAEAVSYLYLYRLMDIGQLVYGGPLNNGNTIILQMVRLITLPFLHCMFSSIAGYYVGLSLYSRERHRAWIVFGVGLAAIIHGLYDFFSTSYLGIIMAAVTILMFSGYVYSSRKITEQVEAQGAVIS
ncbi:PrsW family intramembrane metalloprotease [Deinococcus cellulosilyticus]|uniref:PrsW family intramembrane metalloprotease n=1 Tax=Deinococcus cellulosilyticus (strain DSM 18568 / NBRC 106333 / KACC 11606 / 5516J-15) TaxID=1223518 RepID=A0A511MWH3_DEIC1|nr:PrsW family glutamic-type intramembrane protease [Deinococcus cellulosilyticus]GEM44618.1 hypothetical protein DC3_02530 [Deinococcus cellulosilyticus NBRC 106333 = KACC 11606]